jgi:tripartite-type tricarboxylate transporter receptor subunit TctC
MRHLIITLLVGVAAALLGSGAAAQGTYPDHTIRIIVPFTAGSATDAVARMIGQHITEATKQAVIVDNKPGGGGNIGAEAAAKAPPDGYTIFISTNTTHAANVHLFKKLAYDPDKDFIPVAPIATGPLLFVVAPDSPAKSVADFTALAKAQPGKLSFASGSSSSRAAVELYLQMAGIQMLHVPYKSNPPAVTDLVGGQVQLMIADPTTLLPQIKAGKLKALATSGLKRASYAPELPTIAEGLPGYEMVAWFGAWVPARTPDAVVKRLGDLVRAAVVEPRNAGFWKIQGYEPFPGSGADLAVWQRRETEKWGKIVRAAGIEPE